MGDDCLRLLQAWTQSVTSIVDEEDYVASRAPSLSKMHVLLIYAPNVTHHAHYSDDIHHHGAHQRIISIV